ncbi:hypothetical protein [Bacillus halotolerans]|uniref:hypothetical protein n=1 Tax=Bacillus halotolerans TaxID=260554 RepID=UPI000BFEAC48|nr:hypothetical protein [Bacillus halotolerans]MBL4978415.1 hypothetical protein [Bacillus halotolerans]MCR6595631.1 hypothetical protein [Bacillus halotolerans]MDL5610235.1 hypothetical protein [Bacillus halotolerans]MEC0278137.1 hypothetical protein [Bacillus halotolerans]PHI45317.1 hypothetical protein B9T64_18945 [Bacillus halotolerans]
MRLGSCLYGFVIHVAVFLFVGASMLLVMAVSVPLVFLLDRLPDVVFTAGAIIFLLFFYSLGWFLALRLACHQRMRLFDVQLGSFVLLALLIGLFLSDGTSVSEIVRDWDDAGCAFVPPAFTFLCLSYALVLLPVYQSKLWHLVLPNGVRLKDVVRVCADLMLIMVLLVGVTLLFL